MTARACFSSPKLCWNSIKCKPEIQIIYDVDNQDGCLEVAKWKLENKKLIPCTKDSLSLANRKIKSFSILIGPQKVQFNLNWDSKTGSISHDGHGNGKFICAEMDSFELDRHIEFMASENPRYVWNATMEVEFSHYPFFAEMIRCFTRNEKDGKNFADPPNPKEILKSFDRNGETYKFETFVERKEILKSIHGFVQINVRAPKGSPEQRTYEIVLKLFNDDPKSYKESEKSRNEIQALFISSDYADLYSGIKAKASKFNTFKKKYSEEETLKNPLHDFFAHFEGRKVTWYGKKTVSDDIPEDISDDFQTFDSPLFPKINFDLALEKKYSKIRLDDSQSKFQDAMIFAEQDISTCEHNIHTYLLRRIPAIRGTEIELGVLKDAISIKRSRTDLINAIRDGVDQKMIPANAWDGNREDYKTEFYQNAILSIMMHLEKEYRSVNPIALIRSFVYDLLPKTIAHKERNTNPSMPDRAKYQNTALFNEGWKFYLQLGLGNCGEHAQICFHAFKTLMQKGEKTDYASLLKNVIYSGHRFVDHAFVVGGFELESVRFSNVAPKGAYWSIPDILQKLSTENIEANSFVVDAYMQDVRSMNLRQFLAHLQTLQAKDPQKLQECNFARFQAQYPAEFPSLITDP